MTAAAVGWVLVDGTAAGGRPVDDDEFVVRDPDGLVARCLAAVRGAQAIAASSGRRISAIGVCWSADVEDHIETLLAELRVLGHSDVRSVRQVVPASGENSDDTVERAERVGPCALLAELLADVGDAGSDADDDTTFLDHDVTAGPDAAETSAYGAAQAVLTDAAPAAPVAMNRVRRTFPLPGPATWLPAVAGTRVLTAAAVAAVIAVVAVGSQFVGSGTQQPGEAALAGRSSASTSEVVHPAPPAAPPAVQPMAAFPEPAPAVDTASTPPVQLALPQPPVTAAPPAVEPPVSAVPLAAPEVAVPAAVPVEPVLPAAVPEQVPPVPVDHSAPVVLPTDPLAENAVGPAPGPVPAELPPAPPVDPIQAAIAALFPPPPPPPVPVPPPAPVPVP